MSLLVNAQGTNRSANFRFLQRLAVIFGFRRDCPRSPASCRDYRPRKMASCGDFTCISARQEAKSNRQSLQEAIYRAQQSRQEARDRGQSGIRITRTVSAGSHFSWTVVSAGSSRSRIISAEAKCEGQSLQEAKISGLVYILLYDDQLNLSNGVCVARNFFIVASADSIS